MTSKADRLPDISTTHYRLCGALSLTSKHVKAQQEIRLKAKGSNDVETVVSDASGGFCFWAKPGKYTLSPEISNEDKSKGLILGPRSREVEVIDAGVDNVMFTEKRLSLSVSVIKLNEDITWGDLEVELQGADVSSMKATMKGSSGESFSVLDKKRAQAKFVGLIPTSYTVKVQ